MRLDTATDGHGIIQVRENERKDSSTARGRPICLCKRNFDPMARGGLILPKFQVVSEEAGVGAYLVRPNFKAVLNLAAVLSLGSTSGLAANISLSPLDGDPAHALVAVEGDLEVGDRIKFRTQVGRLTKAFVVFN